MPVDCVCLAYQNLITMYIGNICDRGRFQCMGFLETPFMKTI